MDKPLLGRVALVTGAASGIGRATVHALAEAGATVAAMDRDLAGVERVAAEVDRSFPPVTAFCADLRDRDAITALVDEVLQALARIDLLVNSAGVSGVPGETQQVTEVSDDTFDTVMAVNLRAPFALIREVGRHMLERGGGGRIVNVSSSAAAPEEVASVIRFLCLEDSAQINGQVIHTSAGTVV